MVPSSRESDMPLSHLGAVCLWWWTEMSVGEQRWLKLVSLVCFMCDAEFVLLWFWSGYYFFH